MIRGLYTGASGMISQMHNIDAIANNLANVNTTAYKKDIAIFKAFPEILMRRINDDGVVKFPLGSYDRMPIIGRVGTGCELNEVYTKFEQGSLKQTDNQFDIALEGEGFIAIETAGGTRYTRNGSFLINKESYLVTKEGDYVLGQNGRIQIQAHNFTVDEQGQIMVNADLSGDPTNRLVSYNENDWKSPDIVDRLQVVNFKQPRRLEKQGNSFYRETEESGPALSPALMTKVKQGFIETSNVNVVEEMVRMIEVQRMYEANAKVLQTHDTELGRLVNDVVKV